MPDLSLASFKRSPFFQTQKGRVVVGAAIVGVVALLFWVLGGRSPGAAASADRTYICSKTGKVFKVTLKPGMEIPVKSPYSGEMTGYPAEECFWNADGTTRKEPSFVLVRKYLGEKEETFCPDCGRRVVPHNPAPVEGRPAPPTAEEYKLRIARRAGPAPSRDEEQP